MFPRTQQHAGCTQALGNDKFVLKTMSSNYHMEQNHSSKQNVSMVHRLEKDFFSAVTFKGFLKLVFHKNTLKTSSYILDIC